MNTRTSTNNDSSGTQDQVETGATGQVIVAAIQMVSGPCVQDNLEQARTLVEQAVHQGAQMVALPEYFCLLGPDETAKVKVAEPEGQGPIQFFMSDLARRLGVWVCAGTLPLQSPDPAKVYNTSLMFAPDGASVARYDKIHLFRYTSDTEQFDEGRTILAGTQSVVATCRFGVADRERIGTPDVESASGTTIRVGMSVCYDLRFPEMYRKMGEVDLILVPSAFTYTTGHAHWETLLKARAIENQCYVLAPAQGGTHPHGRRTWGHSMLIDPWGEIIGELPQGPGVIMGQLSLERLRAVRQSLPALCNRVFQI
ncbi:acyltransferase [Orrella marina]|uniref:Acyltransferase n=2 Tax=Orrella marina TaxID=2163011 RepID=A0A2R4XFU1_9BURK|nr:acyltransferase [Orrella marina]